MKTTQNTYFEELKDRLKSGNQKYITFEDREKLMIDSIGKMIEVLKNIIEYSNDEGLRQIFQNQITREEVIIYRQNLDSALEIINNLDNLKNQYENSKKSVNDEFSKQYNKKIFKKSMEKFMIILKDLESLEVFPELKGTLKTTIKKCKIQDELIKYLREERFNNAKKRKKNVLKENAISEEEFKICNLDISKPLQKNSYKSNMIVSCGYRHTAVIDGERNLFTCGKNECGQLGDGTKEDRHEHVQIMKDKKFSYVSCGGNRTAAIDETGKLFMFGWILNGRRGDGTKKNRYEPVQIMKGKLFIQVSCGAYHTAAIDETGNLFMFGWNLYGQLGDGTTEDRNKPVQIMKSKMFIQVSCGDYHTAAIDETGKLFMFGGNSFRQLGIGTSGNKYNKPIKIMKNKKFLQVSCGSTHSAAIDETGKLFMFGGNGFGQLGHGTREYSFKPVQIMKDKLFIQVSCGGDHTAAIDETGKLFMFGDNKCGQLGDGTTEYRCEPVQIMEGKKFRYVLCGAYHTAAIDETGKLFMFGSNNYGQLGNGTTNKSNEPINLMQTA